MYEEEAWIRGAKAGSWSDSRASGCAVVVVVVIVMMVGVVVGVVDVGPMWRDTTRTAPRRSSASVGAVLRPANQRHASSTTLGPVNTSVERLCGGGREMTLCTDPWLHQERRRMAKRIAGPTYLDSLAWNDKHTTNV